MPPRRAETNSNALRILIDGAGTQFDPGMVRLFVERFGPTPPGSCFLLAGGEVLIAAGAAEVVPEALESSVMLATHALALSGIPMHKVIKRLREMREHHYSLLRGFFHGATDAGAHLADADQMRLHAVTLTPATWAIGRCVGDIDLATVGARVTAIRRRTQRGLKLAPELALIEGDVVVLIGTAAAVTAGEDVLLRGGRK